MNRHRAERLARIAQSKGIRAVVYSSAPTRPNASTPWLHCIVIITPEINLSAWCYTTSDFFVTLRDVLNDQRVVRR